MNNKAKIISMWSKVGKQNGVTTTSIAFGVIISKLLPDKNILLIDTNTNFALMENYLDTTNTKSLDTLMDRESVNDLNKENFCNCLNSINTIKEQFNLYSVNAGKCYIYDNIRSVKTNISNILDLSKEMFDFIIIDNGVEVNEISSLINNKADMVVNLIKPNIHVLNHMQETRQLEEILDSEKYYNIFNMYRDSIGIGLNDIEKNWGIKDFGVIPFYSDLDYLVNSGNFVKELSSDNETNYIDAVKDISTNILNLLDVTVEDNFETQNNKKGVFKFFFGQKGVARG